MGRAFGAKLGLGGRMLKPGREIEGGWVVEGDITQQDIRSAPDHSAPQACSAIQYDHG